MEKSDPEASQKSPNEMVRFAFEGVNYALGHDKSGWVLQKTIRGQKLKFRTGTHGVKAAETKAKAWLKKRAEQPMHSKKGGGYLVALKAVYLSTPKRAKEKVANDNSGRLGAICRVLGKTLENTTCREICPEFWERYQRAVIERAGYKFDLSTRHRENIGINSAVRAARSLFLPQFVRAYREAGLDVRPDAGEAVMLPEPYVPPAKVDDVALVAAWAALEEADLRLWLTIGLARFGGLRLEEIAHCRVGWLEVDNAVVHVAMRDRPEEQWWTKTGKPYRPEVIEPRLTEHLLALIDFAAPDSLVVGGIEEDDRGRWFDRAPQRWLREHGIKARQPLHRLRGLYADHVAKLTKDAVTARLAAIRAAQRSLGHTSSTTTENHYLSEESLR